MVGTISPLVNVAPAAEVVLLERIAADTSSDCTPRSAELLVRIAEELVVALEPGM